MVPEMSTLEIYQSPLNSRDLHVPSVRLVGSAMASNEVNAPRVRAASSEILQAWDDVVHVPRENLYEPKAILYVREVTAKTCSTDSRAIAARLADTVRRPCRLDAAMGIA